MKRKQRGTKSRFYVFLIVVLGVLSSCRTVRDLPAERLRPMDAERLIKQVEQNAFDYNDLTIRRINVQFSNSNSKTSFRANLRASKDEKILASISKINIPVGRVLLTPQNVIYVNYLERNYFVDDYSFISSLLNFNLDFETIQAVVTNPSGGSFFATDRSARDFRHYNSTVESGKYILQTSHSDENLNNMRRRNMNSFAPKTVAGNSIQKKFWFNPLNFNLEKLMLHDPDSNWVLEVDYSDFVKVDKKDYPGSIDMKMMSPDEVIELKIKLNGFSTEKIDSVDLNIPDSYERIRVK